MLRHSVRKKQDYLFRLFVALRKFSTGTTRQAVFHLLFNRIFWKLFVIGKRPLGAFHSMKTSSVNFQQLPVASGTASSKYSKTEDDLATNTPNFLSIQLSSRNFRLNCLHFENSPVSGVSGNFSEKFLYHLPLFPNFRKFWLNGKRSMLTTLILDLLKLSSIYTSNYL